MAKSFGIERTTPIFVWDNVALTELGGLAVKLTNKTGSNSIKGTVVKASTTDDLAFAAQAAQYESFGIVYEDGIADGSECFIVVQGVAEVLLEDTTAAEHGNWVYCSTVDGRANATLPFPPGGGIPEHDEHFKEVGHCLQTVSSGTDVLAKCVLHFN
jgi:hypothetical protein